MDGLKVVLKSPLVLRQVNYNYRRLMIVIVYTSLIVIEWIIGQDDKESNWFVIRFGAKILIERQRAYPQIKRELWNALIIIKAKTNYLIGTHVVLKINYLFLLQMVFNYTILDIIMLR